jgi:hypothetical protein
MPIENHNHNARINRRAIKVEDEKASILRVRLNELSGAAWLYTAALHFDFRSL